MPASSERNFDPLPVGQELPRIVVPEFQRAVRWHPPRYDIRVEYVPTPRIIHPDDAIVKIKLSGLCGSDLHIYRGHEDVFEEHTCGHEFVGEVVALGECFNLCATDRPALYSTLRIGDKVVSPFTVSCSECHFCRLGYTCRCVKSALFGTPSLPGGQAQYVRVPCAGGTLFKLNEYNGLGSISDSSLLLLADILPTGYFAVLQALQHPKMLPLLTNKSYPYNSLGLLMPDFALPLRPEDRQITIAVVGLGPVGVCACVSLLDILLRNGVTGFRIVSVDPIQSRREKMQAVYSVIDSAGDCPGTFLTLDIESAKTTVNEWTDGIGCNAVIEVVGNTSALTLSYELVRPFGTISSVGVHQEPPIPLTGREVYNKNVSFDFGRCPVRTMFPFVLDLLLRRQDVFGCVGGESSLIERVVGFEEAAQSYELFDKGKCGKILFDPWM